MLQMLNKSLRSDKGFTLVELVVVVVIIGILAAVAVPLYNAQTKKARLGKIKSELGSLRDAVEAYYAQEGVLPADGDAGKAALVTEGLIPSGSYEDYTYTRESDTTYTISYDGDYEPASGSSVDETGSFSGPVAGEAASSTTTEG